ncbi:hypothetical protein PRK78_006578 [Emydomyces testavorans]|uniref:Uncharacterized protein n=1 Tax=Emydomyces testavorans TaxID=2070801 RepID=A0AAF0DLN6_9EURO|nr:hypothetical protein PRK78_006578 [Emydomyces testavorans]
MGSILSRLGGQNVGQHLQEASTSPGNKTSLFKAIVMKLCPAQAAQQSDDNISQFFKEFRFQPNKKVPKKKLSEEQVFTLTLITQKWKPSNEKLEELKKVAWEWKHNLKLFFDCQKTMLQEKVPLPQCGLIQFCSSDIEHIKGTGPTQQKVDHVLLARSITAKIKEQCLTQKRRYQYTNGDQKPPLKLSS